MKNELEYARNYIDEVLRRMEKYPEKGAISDLLRAVKSIDLYYEEFCDQVDEDYGQPEGTTYRDGISIEFYIEAGAWHDISLALRKLEKEHRKI